MQTENYSPSAGMKSDSLEDRIREAIDSADATAAILTESKSKGGLTPIIAVATYCDGAGFLRDYYEYLDVIDRSGRFFIYLNHFDALKEVYEKAGGRCSRRKLKNVSKKYKNQHKKLPSYSDGDITIVRIGSKGRLSNALYYRKVFYKEEGKPEVNFPLKGQVHSECYKQAKQIRSAYDDFGFSFIELLQKYHPKSKLLIKLRKMKPIPRTVDATSLAEESTHITLGDAIKEYLETKKDRRENTKKQAKYILTRFMGKIGGGEILLKDITRSQAKDYLMTDPPEKSYNHYYRTVNGLFRWAVVEEHIEANPCALLKLERREYEVVQVLSIDECIALLLAAAELFDGELLAYTALIIFGAVRPDSEAKYVKWHHVNFEDGEIRIVKGKTPFPRTFDMSPNLAKWLTKCDQSRPIYPSTYNEFKRKWAAVRRLAGFRGGTVVSHSKKAEVVSKKKAEESARKPWVKDYGRHTAISCRARQTGDIFSTATWAGTSPGVVKKNYLKSVPTSQAKQFWLLEP